MKSLVFHLALATLVAATTTLSQGIVEVALNESLTIFIALVAGYPELLGNLTNGESQYTVFAPTNKAFSLFIPVGGAEDAEKYHHEHQDKVNDILEYHVLPGFFPSSELVSLDGDQTPPTLEGSPINVFVLNDTVYLGPAFPTENTTFAIVTVADIKFYNGEQESVLHVIDAVLRPPSLNGAEEIVDNFIDLLSSSEGDYSHFLDWLSQLRSSLGEIFGGIGLGGFTAFVPNNDAIEELPEELWTFPLTSEAKEQVTTLLKYHVVPKKFRIDDELENGTEFTSVHGGILTLNRDENGSWTVNGVEILEPNLSLGTLNGLANGIGKVLSPPLPE